MKSSIPKRRGASSRRNGGCVLYVRGTGLWPVHRLLLMPFYTGFLGGGRWDGRGCSSDMMLSWLIDANHAKGGRPRGVCLSYAWDWKGSQRGYGVG